MDDEDDDDDDDLLNDFNDSNDDGRSSLEQDHPLRMNKALYIWIFAMGSNEFSISLFK